jgi:hypothetical protein
MGWQDDLASANDAWLTPHTPSSGGSDDYGIGSGGEFGGTVTPEIVNAYDPWESSTSNLPDEYTYSGGYEPYTTSREDQFLSAFGGLNYDWEDPDSSRSDFLTKDIRGNPIVGGPDQRLWGPFKGLSFDEWNTMLDYGEFDRGPIGNYSGRPGGGGGSGGGGSGGRYRSGPGGDRGGGSRMQVAGAGGDGHIWPRWGPFTQQGDYIRGLRRANRGGIVSLC